MKTSTLPIGLALTFTLVISACGKTAGTTATPTPTATPVVTTTAAPAVADRIEMYAKLTASSFATIDPGAQDAFSFLNVVDGAVGNGAGDSRGFIWRPASKEVIDSGWVKFEWNSQVKVTSIYLLDNPAVGHQIKGGRIIFANSVTSTSFTDADFPALTDDGTAWTVVNGPTGAITSLTVRINSHSGDAAGIAEIAVKGTRVSEDIASANIVPYGYISAFSNAIGGYYSDTSDGTGPNRPAMAKDGTTATAWRTAGGGPNAYIEFKFDRLYTMDQIRLDDVPEGAAQFSTATVTFPGLSGAPTITIASNGTKVLPSTVTHDRVRIALDTAPSGSNSGLSEVTIRGIYTP
ncbi:MAG: hypothetical protein V1495_02330 [Pseudomonadota bacterium]